MTKTEMLDKIEALRCVITDCEKQINDIKEELEKSEVPGVWIPNVGDTYYSIGKVGNVIGIFWNHDLADEYMLSIGNVFRTEDDAEFMVERLKVLAELRRLANGFIPDWEDDNRLNWMLECCYDRGYSIRPKFRNRLNEGTPVYFQSKEDAQEAIDAIGTDRLLKYYFMVKKAEV